MKLIVGLGNPGPEYEKTKHNVGFWVIDKILEDLGLTLDKNKFNGAFIKHEDFVIAKPFTFMNNSGHFVKDLISFFKISPDDILVIYDDMDFEVGQAAIKNSGSAGGHNGMKDIIEQLGTDNIKRMKIGISRSSRNMKNYVLTPFSAEKQKAMNQVVEKAAEAAINFLSNDIRIVVERFNAANKRKKDTISS